MAKTEVALAVRAYNKKRLLKEYDDIHFDMGNGHIDLTTNVERITKTFLKYGLVLNNTKQTINGLVYI